MSHGLSDHMLRLPTDQRPRAFVENMPREMMEEQILYFKRQLRAGFQRERFLWEALREWGWHLAACPSVDGINPQACTCGFTPMLRVWEPASARQKKHRSRQYFRLAVAAYREMQRRSRTYDDLRRLRRQHDLLVGWLAEAGRPLDDVMRKELAEGHGENYRNREREATLTRTTAVP